MILGSIPCSCGGENSNCFRCFGSGMLESKAKKNSPKAKTVKDLTRHAVKTGHGRQKTWSDPRLKPVASGLRTAAVGFVICRYCQGRFSDDVQMTSHVLTIHGMGNFQSLGIRSQS